MKEQGAKLSDTEKGAVAAFLTGKNSGLITATAGAGLCAEPKARLLRLAQIGMAGAPT